MIGGHVRVYVEQDGQRRVWFECPSHQLQPRAFATFELNATLDQLQLVFHPAGFPAMSRKVMVWTDRNRPAPQRSSITVEVSYTPPAEEGGS